MLLNPIGMNRPIFQTDGKGNCPYCHKPVKRGGLEHWGLWYHRQCLRIQEQSHLPKYKARHKEL